MRILYFDWNEFTGPDCREVMARLGHTVGTWRHLWNCLSVDEEFSERTERALYCRAGAGANGRDYGGAQEKTPQWDVVFSFNYYPIISEVCERAGVPYISWTFDSPYLPVTSTTNRNKVNVIYLFDRALYEEMRGQGIETVRYLPLAVNGRRLWGIREACDRERRGAGGGRYAHEISFVGSLYADKGNFYNAISGELPVILRSYLEDVMQLQMNVFGQDLIGDGELVSDEILAELGRYIRFEAAAEYRLNRRELLRNLLRMQATEMDRFSLLEALGRAHPGGVDLYTRWDAPELPGVRNLGYAYYLEVMPRVFYTSRVNLNVTLRTIRTGAPLRALDVMAAGGFLLSTWQAELDEYFENGRELALAHDPEEMLVLADWFLAHDAEREEIARRGCARVCEQFDYERVLPGMLNEFV